jgi:protein-tyrosine phosphatase
MAPGIDADEVAERLWIGSCPGTPEIVQTLGEVVGVTGLVSLQTDDDLRSLGLSWSLLSGLLTRAGIAAERVPIEDFDEEALVGALPDAIDAVHRMISAGRTTYLHCTAGLNRSPTVAIGYLIEHGGLTRAEAWRRVHERRRVMPLTEALDLWLARRGA